MKKDLQTHYNQNLDMWYIDVPHALTDMQMLRIRRYLIGVWTDKVACTPGGARRDFYNLGLAALIANRIQMRMTHLGDQDYFKSTERERPDRTIFIGSSETIDG